MDGRKEKKYARQWFVAGALLLVLGIATAYDVYVDHRKTESVEDDRLMVQARVIDENLKHQLVATYETLHRIEKDLSSWRIGPAYKPATNLMLKTLEEAMPGIRTLLILDAQGIARASSRPELINRDLSDRDYFQTVRSHPDSATFFLSPPYTTVLKVYAMNASLMIHNPAGEFDGIIVATLDPDYFKTLLLSVQYAPDMWAAIAHGDGIQFLMVPDREGQSGKNLAQPGSFFSRHRESGRDENIMLGTVYATGEERVMAIRTIRPEGANLDKPLIVAVGRDIHALLAGWRRSATVYAIVYFGIVLVSVFSLRYNQSIVQQADERDRQARIALEKSEEHYRILAENTTDVVWQLDLRTMKYTYVSPSVYQLRGYTAEEVMAQPVEASLTPASLKDVQAWMGQMLEEISRGRADPHADLKEVEQPRKDGTTVWTEVSTTYVVNDEKQPIGVIGISRDITERRRVEAARTASEVKFRAIFDKSIDAIGVSRAGIHEFVNPAYAALFGYATGDELAGRPVLDLIAPGEHATIRDRIRRRALGEAVPTVYETRGLRRDGSEFVMDVHASSYALFGERYTLVIMRDISDVKRAERDREQLIAELQNALAEIKTLHGILPICSGCKKIRDDKGAWTQMETYIMEHTSAEFSHGLCAECAKKLYPEYYENDTQPPEKTEEQRS